MTITQKLKERARGHILEDALNMEDKCYRAIGILDKSERSKAREIAIDDFKSDVDLTIQSTITELLEHIEGEIEGEKVCTEVNDEQKARDEAFEIEGYNYATRKVLSLLSDIKSQT